MIMLPGGTSTFWPSSSISTIVSRLVSGGGVGLDHGRELGPEMLEHGAHRHRRRIAQGANGAAHDVFSHVVQQRQVGSLGFAALNLVHQTPEPARAFATGRALPAGLVHVEVRQALERL